MKLKTTKREIKENSYYIIGIGYCGAQYLLQYTEPFAYSAGVYGWSCDYYNIDGVIISTGYSYIDNKNSKSNYDLLRKYEKKAEKIVYNYDISHKVKKNKLNKLLKAFINEVVL